MSTGRSSPAQRCSGEPRGAHLPASIVSARGATGSGTRVWTAGIVRRYAKIDRRSSSVTGRYDDALRLMRMEVEREPDRAVNHLELGRVYVQKGDYKNGIESMRRAHALAGDEPLFDAVLGYGLARAGQRVEAEAIFERLMRESATRRVPPYYLAVLCAGLGRPDDAFHWLDQVLRERHIGALSLAVEPELASLRSDPRFHDLRRRAGLN